MVLGGCRDCIVTGALPRPALSQFHARGLACGRGVPDTWVLDTSLIRGNSPVARDSGVEMEL
ncbi:hypothetical protein ASG92_08880 [Arthrobacter sp. Soil736]|nr:hypothetical protein ASG92_08880 [Arthrobacter sp. Soil736]